MRVGFVTHYAALYGANRSLLNLIDGLRAHGVESCVVMPEEGDLARELSARKVPFASMPLQWWVSPYRWRREQAARLFSNLRLLPRLARQLRRWNVHAVYTNSAVIPSGAFAAKLLKRPHIWHLREFVGLDYGFHYDWGERPFRAVLQWAEAIIAVSEPVRAHLVGERGREKTHVIHNGVAWEAEFDRFYQQASRKHADGSRYTFALVGVIHPAKGQKDALAAMARLKHRFPGARLLIVGSGRKRDTDECRRLAHELGLDERVEFPGYIDNPYSAYFAADAVLMCSKHEALGRATIEAMASCRPVIGYDSAGTSELIEHEATGLLYRGGPEELAECMERFIERPNWARQLGQNGWRVARAKFTIERYAGQVYGVLDSVVRHRA